MGEEAETDRFPLTHTAANRLSAEQLGKRERRWRTGSSDKALVLLPIQRPCSHISACEGETERSGERLGISPWQNAAAHKKRWREKERGLPSHLFPQCRISPHQHTCQPDGYERFSNAAMKETISKLKTGICFCVFMHTSAGRISSAGFCTGCQKMRARKHVPPVHVRDGRGRTASGEKSHYASGIESSHRKQEKKRKISA